jgi:hypothetical protein
MARFVFPDLTDNGHQTTPTLKIGLSKKGADMTKETDKKLSAGKRLAGFLFIILVMIVSFVVPFFLVSNSFTRPNQMSELPEIHKGPDIVGHIVLMFLAGSFFLAGGISGYALTLGTHCFTFNFQNPFWNSVKKKLHVMRIVVILLTLTGIVFFVSMVITPILMAIGLSWSISFTAPLMGTFVLIQFLTTWIDIWQPLAKSMLKKRLATFGISSQEIEKGTCIGISNPAKSSFKKMTMVEEDVGVLWLHDNELIYNGDTDSFNISREQFIEVERVADAGSMSAYFGNVHVIIRFRITDGTERRLRLHPETAWTMSGRAKESDALAARIICWKEGRPQTSNN